MKIILITGERGAGKSTLLEKTRPFLKELFPSVKICGFITKLKQPEDNKRIVTFKLIDKKEEIIIAETLKNKMTTKEEGFKKASILLKNLISEGKILIIDELGYLESHFKEFQKEVFRLISEAKFSIAVIRKMKTPFLDKIKNLKDAELIEVNNENRNSLAGEIKKALVQNQCFFLTT